MGDPTLPRPDGGAAPGVATAGSGGDVVGWDIGGAHVKACLTRHGRVLDVAQWACPLWQGLAVLDATLQRAALRWPALHGARHAVTMTGEMADLFEHREDGVRRIAAALLRHWPAERVRFFAGAAPDHQPGGDRWGDGRSDAGRALPPAGAAPVAAWCDAAGIDAQWPRIASANWLATALHLASADAAAAPPGTGGLLVDIGSTTTDIVAFGGGRVLTTARSDAERLESGELVYHGVVRTPLCALARRIGFRGTPRNVMNELFATTADVYRLTGELNSDHDLYRAADNAAKDVPATQRRLARMIGLDGRDAASADWLALARSWRAEQLAVLRGNLRRVAAAHRLAAGAVLVSAGCGDFLVPELAAALPIVNPLDSGGRTGDNRLETGDTGDNAPAAATAESVGAGARHDSWRCVRYAQRVPGAAGGIAARLQLCAPSVAVALLFEQDHAPARHGDAGRSTAGCGDA